MRISHTIVIDDDSDDDEPSRAQSPPTGALITSPLNPAESEPADRQMSNSLKLEDNHDSNSSPDLDDMLPSWLPSNSLMNVQPNEPEVRDSHLVPRGHETSTPHSLSDSTQIEIVRSAMNALQAISNYPGVACAKDRIDIADENLLHLETIHGLSFDTIAETGLGTFLEREMVCTFPKDDERGFRDRLRSLFLQCDKIKSLHSDPKKEAQLVTTERDTIFASAEPVGSESAAITTPPPRCEELPSTKRQTLHSHETPSSDQTTEELGPSSTESRTDLSPSNLDDSPQSNEQSPSPSSSQLASDDSTLESDTADTGPAIKPDLEDTESAAETSSSIQQRLADSPDPQPEVTDTQASVRSKIKALEQQINDTTRRSDRAEKKLVETSMAAGSIREQIKIKKEEKKPLFVERRRLQDKINAINAELRDHELELQEKDEAAQKHGEDKTDAQNLLNKLAASKKKQEKKLEHMLQNQRLRQEIPDPTLRALARQLRRQPEDDPWAINSDSSSSSRSGSVSSYDSNSDNGDEDDDQDSLFSSEDGDAEVGVKQDASDTETEPGDVLHDLVDAITRVAGNDSNEATISDFAQMSQVLQKFTGTRDIKDDSEVKDALEGKVAVKSEIKREAVIKTEDDGESGSKNAVDVKDSIQVDSSTRHDTSDIDLTTAKADDLLEDLATVQRLHARLQRKFALLRGDSVSVSPAPVSPFDDYPSPSSRKRKQSANRPNFFDRIGSARSRQTSRSAGPVDASNEVAGGSFSNYADLPAADDDDEDADSEEVRPAKRSKTSPAASDGSPSRLRRTSLIEVQKSNGQKKPEPILNSRRGSSVSKSNESEDEDGGVMPEVVFPSTASRGVKKPFDRSSTDSLDEGNFRDSFKTGTSAY